ncbi:Hsp20/alpha crystallin family protein [Haliangium sp.]|uniref:Hsp20/alpha crystallin family protein n=1 Tax=Haliangium sp. TaxID=2663208 RepID=UPI003D1080A9
MTKLTTNRGNARYRVSDPFSLARSIFGYDPFFDEPRAAKATFSPAFEVKEREDAYLVVADVPGVAESDLDLSINGNVLTVSGSRAAEPRREGETYYLYERPYGSFSRSFSLPDEANTEAIAAKLDAGVLTVTIGKRAESKPRKIALSNGVSSTDA